MENCKNGVEFTAPENKIRKKWLFWSTLLPAFFLGSITIFAVARLFIAAEFKAMMGIVLLLLFPVGGLYLHYYCAYKNPGTILLLLEMIGISINLITTFLKPSNLDLMKASPVFSLFILTLLCFYIILLYYSHKLREANKKIKERRLAASPAYINDLSTFSTATNLEQLNEQFTKLRPSYDSGGGVEVLAKAYEQQKKMLMLATSSLND